MAPRNLPCPETEGLCDDPRCKIGHCCEQVEREAAERVEAAAREERVATGPARQLAAKLVDRMVHNSR